MIGLKLQRRGGGRGGCEVWRFVEDRGDCNDLPGVVFAVHSGHKILCEVKHHHFVVKIKNIGEEGRFDIYEPVEFKDDGGR